jgi:MarR family transcriptional regulator, organic hydroperoxide resistance regulator
MKEENATDLLKLDQQLCFPLYAVSRLVTQAYQPMLQELDITYPQYLVMLLLWEHDSLSVKEIGDKLLLDSGTLTPLLKRMEKKQWISRSRDPKDERSVIIALQEAGKGMREKACNIPVMLAQKMGLSSEELIQLRNLIYQLLNQLK